MRKLLLLLGFFILGLSASAEDDIRISIDKYSINSLTADDNWTDDPYAPLIGTIIIDADVSIVIETPEIEIYLYITEAQEPTITERNKIFWECEVLNSSIEFGIASMLLDPNDGSAFLRVEFPDTRWNFSGFIE